MAGTVLTLRDAADRRADVDLLEEAPDGGLVVRWRDRRLHVPATAIAERDGDEVRLALPLSDLGADVASDGERTTIPLVEERLATETREIPTGTVRVRTRTDEREETVDERLARETVDVERVPVDRFVDAPAAVREEGDTTIVPLHEEVLVVEKRLLLKEELRLTRRREERNETRRVTLRSQEADVDRDDIDPNDPDEA